MWDAKHANPTDGKRAMLRAVAFDLKKIGKVLDGLEVYGLLDMESSRQLQDAYEAVISIGVYAKWRARQLG